MSTAEIGHERQDTEPDENWPLYPGCHTGRSKKPHGGMCEETGDSFQKGRLMVTDGKNERHRGGGAHQDGVLDYIFSSSEMLHAAT